MAVCTNQGLSAERRLFFSKTMLQICVNPDISMVYFYRQDESRPLNLLCASESFIHVL